MGKAPGSGSQPTKRAPRKSRAKNVADPLASSDMEFVGPATKKPRSTVNWSKNTHWTDMLITYLSENPVFRRKLFSDSTAEARKRGEAKVVAKDGKPQQYAVLAKVIFENDPGEQARYANDKKKYADSIETRLRRLKKEYKEWVETLGATGAGLDPDSVISDSPIANLMDEIRNKWPWWDDLHAFWRELPNYNPVTSPKLV